ncbi:MAG: NTP transferase domain-containing protein [Planctomycetota bacterium]
MTVSLGRVVAIVPAKGHSARLPGKNLLPFGDATMIGRKVRQLVAVDAIDEVVVGTDSDRIAFEAEAYGATVRPRDAYHCDESRCPANDMIRNLAAMVEADTVLWAHCTNPLVSSARYADALAAYAADDACDSLCSVTADTRHAWFVGDPLNFDPWAGPHPLASGLPPVHHQNGAIFVQPHRQMLDNAYFYGRRPLLYPLPWTAAVDIDTRDDYRAALALQRPAAEAACPS